MNLIQPVLVMEQKFEGNICKHEDKYVYCYILPNQMGISCVPKRFVCQERVSGTSKILECSLD